MTAPDSKPYYKFQLPPDEEIEPTIKDCDLWVSQLLAGLGADGDLLIFAYGSLIWDTDFPVLDRTMAHLYGYHRSFCVYSIHYRGTRAQPGLVLGLDKGGSCRGQIFRVARRHAADVANYLWRREMVSHAYQPRAVRVGVGSEKMTAHTFVADPGHEQYAGRLSFAETVQLIRQGHGSRGANRDYLDATLSRLEGLGIGDRPLRRLMDELAG